MSLFRITHVDEHRTRRRVQVMAQNCRQALHAVEQEFGDAWYACAVRVEGVMSAQQDHLARALRLCTDHSNSVDSSHNNQSNAQTTKLSKERSSAANANHLQVANAAEANNTSVFTNAAKKSLNFSSWVLAGRMRWCVLIVAALAGLLGAMSGHPAGTWCALALYFVLNGWVLASWLWFKAQSEVQP